MFPLAAPPDILRASQKDEYFQANFRDECRELASAVLGHRSSGFESEIDFVSNLLYHGVTTFGGKQTLGEEYCDLLPTRAVRPTLMMIATAAAAAPQSKPRTATATATAVAAGTPNAAPIAAAANRIAPAARTAAAPTAATAATVATAAAAAGSPTRAESVAATLAREAGQAPVTTAPHGSPHAFPYVMNDARREFVAKLSAEVKAAALPPHAQHPLQAAAAAAAPATAAAAAAAAASVAAVPLDPALSSVAAAGTEPLPTDPTVAYVDITVPAAATPPLATNPLNPITTPLLRPWERPREPAQPAAAAGASDAAATAATPAASTATGAAASSASSPVRRRLPHHSFRRTAPPPAAGSTLPPLPSTLAATATAPPTAPPHAATPSATAVPHFTSTVLTPVSEDGTINAAASGNGSGGGGSISIPGMNDRNSPALAVITRPGPEQYRLLSRSRRGWLVFLHVCVPYLYHRLRKNARRVQSDPADEPPSMFRRVWTAVWNRFVSLLIRSDSMLSYAQRIHLMLFYLFGSYYHLSKRGSGVRYIFLRRTPPGPNGQMSPDMDRPSYNILGVLIAVQLVITAVRAIRDAIVQSRAARAERERNQQFEREAAAGGAAAGGAGAGGAGAVGDQKDEKEDAEAADEDPNAKCTLCLSARRHTTSTECGHLFCWACISESATNKPECPLCRSPILLTNLLRVAHYRIGKTT